MGVTCLLGSYSSFFILGLAKRCACKSPTAPSPKPLAEINELKNTLGQLQKL